MERAACTRAAHRAHDRSALGEPLVVRHFHGGRTTYRTGSNVFSTGPSNAVTSDFIIYDISDLASNIWLMRTR